MGLFDSIQNLIGGVSDAATGAAGDALGGLVDNQKVQDIQDQAANVTDLGADATTSATESGQAVVDDITQNLGL